MKFILKIVLVGLGITGILFLISNMNLSIQDDYIITKYLIKAAIISIIVWNFYKLFMDFIEFRAKQKQKILNDNECLKKEIFVAEPIFFNFLKHHDRFVFAYVERLYNNAFQNKDSIHISEQDREMLKNICEIHLPKLVLLYKEALNLPERYYKESVKQFVLKLNILNKKINIILDNKDKKIIYNLSKYDNL